MAVGYTALLLDVDTHRMVRETYGINHPAAAVATPRIVERMNASRADLPAQTPGLVRVVGMHETADLRVLLVEVDGNIRRRDGGFYAMPLFVPLGGLHARTIDELAQALLATIPADKLRNHNGGEVLSVRPRFVMGVERPKALSIAPRQQVAPAGFVRAG